MTRKLSAIAHRANVEIPHTQRPNCSSILHGLRVCAYLHSDALGGSYVWHRWSFLEVARREREPRKPPGGHAPPAERPRPRQRRRGVLPRPGSVRIVEGVAVQPGPPAG